MAREAVLEIVAQARAPNGVAFQVRKDARGTLEVPGLDSVLVSVHLGLPARVACRRAGRNFAGTAVHEDIDIIPAHTPARWEMRDGNDTALVLLIPETIVHGVAERKFELRDRFQTRDPELAALGGAIRREIEAGCPTGAVYLDGLSLAIAARLVARHSSLAAPATERPQGLAGARLKRALAFIEEELAEDLRLDRIASEAGLGASHFQAEFRKAMGMPVHRYVIERRVERARELMAREDLTMADIAQASGFAHQSHMARHVRRILGAAPLEAKRRLASAAGL